MRVDVPIKRGTAYRLGLEPPRGPMLGVVTFDGVMSPEEYEALEDRFAKAAKGNWQFVYTEDVAVTRARRRWWPWKSLAARMEDT